MLSTELQQAVVPPSPGPAIRSLHPGYASFNTFASEEAERPRVAVRADISSNSLLTFLHKATGSSTQLECELRTSDKSSVVKVLGWRTVQSKQGSHIVYTILAASRLYSEYESAAAESEARMVQRRFKDFVKLHMALMPLARRANLPLPSLPSKLGSLLVSTQRVGAQRKEALHMWLQWVVSQPALMCDELRLFLGLIPHDPSKTSVPRPESATDSPQHSEREDDDVMDVEPTTPPAASGRKRDSKRDVVLPAAAGFTVDLKELELKAVDTLMDDALWGRRVPQGAL